MTSSIDTDPTDPTSGAAGTDDGAPFVGVDGRAFSLKALATATAALAVGGFLGGLVPLIGGTIGRALGLAGAAFALGLLVSNRRYVETGLAGAGVGTASALLGVVSVGFLPVGVGLLRQYGLGVAAVGALVGLLVALVGHYFGRDLRAGLARDLDA